VREAGGDTLDGLSMLVGQGAESFTLWTGVSIPDEEFDKAVNMLEEQL
jgi:shikimate 5-dehydrogenase